jgi:hypothetical protein
MPDINFIPFNLPPQCDVPPPSGKEIIPKVSERRSDSFLKLLSDIRLRKEFKEGFLKNVFDVIDSDVLFRLMVKVGWDTRNTCDNDIYVALIQEIERLKVI